MTRAFKALGDPNRLAIFQLLKELWQGKGVDRTEEEVERSLSEIAEKFDLALSTVSHHLKELRNARLVRCIRRGQRIHCTVNWELVRELEEFLKGPR